MKKNKLSTIISLIIAGVASPAIHATSCAPELYGINYSGGQGIIYKFNEENTAVSVDTMSLFNASSLAYQSTTDRIYYISKPFKVNGKYTRRLAYYDKNLEINVDVGPTSYVYRLAFSPDGSTLWGSSRDKVYHFDLISGAATLVGKMTGFQPFSDKAGGDMLFIEDKLYMFTYKSVYEVNTSTLALTKVQSHALKKVSGAAKVAGGKIIVSYNPKTIRPRSSGLSTNTYRTNIAELVSINAPASFISSVPYLIDDLASSVCIVEPITVDNISSSSASVNEGDSRVVTVALSGTTVEAVFLNLELSPESAQAGVDYSTNIDVSFDGGATWSTIAIDNDGKASVSVPIGVDNVQVKLSAIQDAITEVNETFEVLASIANDESDQQGLQITIIDQASPAQQELTSLSSASQYVDEGNSSIFSGELKVALSIPTQVELTLVHVDTNASDISSTVDISFDGGVTWPSFVNLANPATISVPAGQTGFKVRVNTLNDSLVESDEEFTITAYSLVGNNQQRDASVLIKDKTISNPSVSSVQVSPNPVNEGTSVSVLVSLSGQSDGNNNYLVELS